MRAKVSSLVIFDTSIFIDNLRSGRHQHRIDSLTGLVRTSAVVLAELWRGAAKAAEAVGQLDKATAYFGKLAELTKDADAGQPEIQEAKAFLARR